MGIPNARVLLFGATAVTPCLYFLFNILGSPEALVARFSIDDSFYYLQIAWQTGQSGFVTFDGIHQTNGVHFLWFVIVYLIALFSPDKLFLLHATYFAALCLVVLTYGLIWRAGTLLRDRWRALTLLFALLWTIILAGKSHQMFVGMESTLHMATLWACFVAFIHFAMKLDAQTDFPRAPFLMLSASLIPITWARLDSVVYAALIYLSVLFISFKKRGVRAVLAADALPLSVALICAGAAIQIGFYWLSAGTIIPISGLVKAATPHETSREVLGSFFSILFPFGDLAVTRETWFWIVGGSAFALLFGYVIRQHRRSAGPISHVFLFAALLGAGTVLLAALNGPHFAVFSRWYLAPVYLFYIIGCSCFLYRTLCKPDAPGQADGIVMPVLVSILYLLSIAGLSKSYMSDPLYIAHYRQAHFLRDDTRVSDVIASFNAGLIGYFSDRTVVNLDGLVNDRHYFENVLKKSGKLVRYLLGNEVEFIVDYDFYWANTEVYKNSDLVYYFPMYDRNDFVLQLRRMKWE